MNKINKIFIIGSNKTGTTSIQEALQTLGFEFCPVEIMFNEENTYLQDYQDGNYEELYNIADQYTAFKDRPWNHTDFYKRLDSRYKDSKFILTIRDVDSWIKSYRRWNEKIKLYRRWHYKIQSQTCYGVDDFMSMSNENIIIEKYNQRNSEIIKYFEGTNNLFVFKLEENNGWKDICSFLYKEIPNKKFPHANKT